MRGEQRRPLNGFPSRLRGNAVRARGNCGVVELDKTGRCDYPGKPGASVRGQRIIGPDKSRALGIVVEFPLRVLEIDACLFELLGHEVARIGGAIETALQVRLNELFGKGIGDVRRQRRVG